MKLNCMRKLRSQSGVSLSVALLFFVVCAALASMILAAAYAASGRVTKTMSLDQSQYAADSAASFPVYAYTQERPGIHPGNPDLTIVDSYAHDSSIRTGFFLIS